MITFQLKNWRTGNVQFTGEINCAADAKYSVKVGLTVRLALKSGAYLGGADLRDADLRDADLRDADLRDADLRGANMRYADLSGAYLSGAYLSGANLRGADLDGADLRDANLRDADLSGANLSGAYLSGACGVNDYVKALHLEEWPITYTATYMQIGCERHGLEEWREFSDERILRMDGERALKFWRKYKEHIFATIALCPAEPTQVEEKAA